MKLEKDIIYIVIGSKKLLCCLGIMILFEVSLFAQDKDISIELELVNVCIRSSEPNHLGLEKGDTIPYRITFEFIVYNNTQKSMLFGSNTKSYYRNEWTRSECGIIGSFLMINDKDTIALYTDYGSLVPRPHGSSFTCWGSIDDIEDSEIHPAFAPFLKKWSNTKGVVDKIYNYLNSSRFVYVPIDSDYERRINTFDNLSISNDIVHPRNNIEVRKQFPFIIIISESDDKYFVFPPQSTDDYE